MQVWDRRIHSKDLLKRIERTRIQFVIYSSLPLLPSFFLPVISISHSWGYFLSRTKFMRKLKPFAFVRLPRRLDTNFNSCSYPWKSVFAEGFCWELAIRYDHSIKCIRCSLLNFWKAEAVWSRSAIAWNKAMHPRNESALSIIHHSPNQIHIIIIIINIFLCLIEHTGHINTAKIRESSHFKYSCKNSSIIIIQFTIYLSNLITLDQHTCHAERYNSSWTFWHYRHFLCKFHCFISCMD